MSVYNINGEEIGSSGAITDEVKSSLLDCFRHLALWNDPNGSAYVNVLERALYPSEYPKITALLDSTYTPIINDAVNTLKDHLTVKYYENEESSGQTVQAEDYSLIGNLNNPQNDVLVSYASCITILTVNVLDIYNIHRWVFPINTLVHSATGVFNEANKLTANNARRSLYLDHGIPVHRITYLNGESINDGNAYYIPIPRDSTQVKVTISPASWTIAFHVLKIIEGSPVGWIAGADGWSTGNTKIATFNASEGLVIGVSYRNGDSSLVSSDASSIVIECS